MSFLLIFLKIFFLKMCLLSKQLPKKIILSWSYDKKGNDISGVGKGIENKKKIVTFSVYENVLFLSAQHNSYNVMHNIHSQGT